MGSAGELPCPHHLPTHSTEGPLSGFSQLHGRKAPARDRRKEGARQGPLSFTPQTTDAGNRKEADQSGRMSSSTMTRATRSPAHNAASAQRDLGLLLLENSEMELEEGPSFPVPSQLPPHTPHVAKCSRSVKEQGKGHSRKTRTHLMSSCRFMSLALPSLHTDTFPVFPRPWRLVCKRGGAQPRVTAVHGLAHRMSPIPGCQVTAGALSRGEASSGRRGPSSRPPRMTKDTVFPKETVSVFLSMKKKKSFRDGTGNSLYKLKMAFISAA